MPTTRGGKETGPDAQGGGQEGTGLGEAKAGEHRRAQYKAQDAPEHNKHQQEKLAKQLQDLE